jgi:GTPase SAR1 family protein
VLVGNKCDLEDQRVISKEEAEKLAKINNLTYIETSAKSNINVK